MRITGISVAHVLSWAFRVSGKEPHAPGTHCNHACHEDCRGCTVWGAYWKTALNVQKRNQSYS